MKEPGSPAGASLAVTASGVAGDLVRGFARHLDVAAQGKQADLVVGFAVLEAEKARPKAEGERLHAHPAQLGDGKMSKLVDDHHDADQDDKSYG